MMKFAKTLRLNQKETLSALGYKAGAVDAHTRNLLEAAAGDLEQTVTPRWVYRKFPLQGMLLEGTGQTLQGQDIAAHLAGCDACILLALTLGTEAEQLMRAAETNNMARAVLLDMGASVLVEQYADLAQATLQAELAAQGLFATGRFSPGYGDFPLAIQPDFLRLLDAPRAIGLTTNQNCLLLPRKSITAVMGVASHPVQGRLAGCAHCALQDKCEFRKEGKTCGTDI